MTRDPTLERWLDVLGTQPATTGTPDPSLPTSAEVWDRLRLLAVPEADRTAVLTTLPDPIRTPTLWQALLHCHRALFTDARVNWPNAPSSLGAAGRYFYVHLYVLALPLTLEWQHRYGIPADVTRATLTDLGAKLVTHRRAHGTGGLDRQTWLVRHFRGTLHRLGRLQFERTTLDATACGGKAEESGGPEDGAPVLDVHIPADGPLPPAHCDTSFTTARDFYAHHFPATPYPHATCHSWLLDTQLAAHLPTDANILRFQHRFHLFGDRPVCDDDILEFVFGTPPGTADLTRLPQHSTLQRAIVAQLRSGGHWRLGHGWADLGVPD
ncbi:DUF5596 domain-containing protein [Streptomyces sp. A7024]|uniref:DUF5596 domain-containing protein n=1 Tax=Streptomyces coryli TaxID=1128680 RepID=A0A6G4TS08_9ACTN|nr:acyltransferase domain-containing protein [Streptomyces coryli]NGN62572.1 DUF5596 domain-containing protein [Streptomyces coryli]